METGLGESSSLSEDAVLHPNEAPIPSLVSVTFQGAGQGPEYCLLFPESASDLQEAPSATLQTLLEYMASIAIDAAIYFPFWAAVGYWPNHPALFGREQK